MAGLTTTFGLELGINRVEFGSVFSFFILVRAF
jgi:hypothetical protein